MDNFSMNLQVEDSTDYIDWEHMTEYLNEKERDFHAFKNSVKQLSNYFWATNENLFAEAVDEAYTNASGPVKVIMESFNIFDVEDLEMFIRGYRFHEC